MSTEDFALPDGEFQEVSALHWISRFGWLRSRELGALMWPQPGSNPGTLISDPRRMDDQRKLANKLLSRLKESRYVLQRHLPGKAGNAYVLSLPGVHYLQRRLAYTARPGDKWGRSINGTWQPPASWEHELLVTLTMLYFLSSDAKIKTESEIRAENPGQRKYPDGLVVTSGHRKDGSIRELVLWIEVESADKSGTKMLGLARSLVNAYRQNAPTLSGLKANVPAIVYRADLVNLARRKVDHKNRITNAVQRHIGADIQAYFLQIKFQNSSYHVEEVDVQRTRIHPLDPDDKKTEIRFAFAPIKNGGFVNTSIDAKGKDWTLKVVKWHDRYRFEIWTAPNPGEGEPHMEADHQVPNLEQGFRAAIKMWRGEFHDNSY